MNKNNGTTRVSRSELQKLLTEGSKKGPFKEKKQRNDYEHQEQAAFFKWRDTLITKIPLMSSIHSNPSGGHRETVIANKMKIEGSTHGLTDIAWPLPRGNYMGFYHELKVQYPNGTHNKPTKSQLEWMRYLDECGYRVGWSIGWEAMRDAVLDYYNLGESVFIKNAITPLNL